MHVLFFQHFRLAAKRLCLGESLAKCLHPGRIGVIDIPQFRSGFDKAVALPVNVAMVKGYRGKNKFPVLDHRRWLALGGVIHSI